MPIPELHLPQRVPLGLRALDLEWVDDPRLPPRFLFCATLYEKWTPLQRKQLVQAVQTGYSIYAWAGTTFLRLLVNGELAAEEYADAGLE